MQVIDSVASVALDSWCMLCLYCLGVHDFTFWLQYSECLDHAFCFILYRDIIRGSPDVKWESIKGLENAKRLLKEAVVMPIKYPK